VLAGNLDAAKFIGLKPNRRIRLFNAQIECRLLKFAIYALGPRREEPAESQRDAL
jgi:putative N6-adenine-specific DNA methylase